MTDEIIVGIAQAVGRLEASTEQQNKALERIETRLSTLEAAPARKRRAIGKWVAGIGASVVATIASRNLLTSVVKRILLSLSILALFAVSLSCSSASAFTGPVSDQPTISISYQRHFVQDDPRLPSRIETITTANISNPSTHDMDLTLECTQSLHLVTVKARTTEHVLLDPGDAECVLR